MTTEKKLFSAIERTADYLPQFVTADVLAKLLGLSKKRIANLVLDGMFFSEGHNKYDLHECTKKYLQGLRSRTGKNDDMTAAKLEKIQRENLEAAGQLLDIGKVEQLIMQLASIIVEQLESLSPRVSADLAPLADPAQIQDILFEECRLIRDNIANTIEDRGINISIPVHHKTPPSQVG